MRSLRSFVAGILWVEVSAVLGLWSVGAALTWIEQGYRYGDGFFTYRICHFDYLPAWFTATLALIALNGFWTFRLANLEGRIHSPAGTAWGEWGAFLPINPLRLFAVNLVAIPALLGLFLIIRAQGW